MKRSSQFLKELNKESEVTRKMLSAVPNDKYDWKPHPKSMNIRQLTGHIAELPSWIKLVMNTDELDFSKEPYTSPEINNTNELIQLFEKHLAEGQQALENADEALLDKPWTLRDGAQIFNTEPKADVIRMSLSQIIHHRAQLGVFLRLLNVPIPGSYGPSADENSFH